MAFLQSEIPPSTAPVRSRQSVSAGARPVPMSRRRAPSTRLARIAAGLACAMMFAVPGYLAAAATESLAIGILATDFAFLLVVAGWSAVAGASRR